MFKNDFEIIYEQKSKNLDFIAIATSHWHALGIDAFLYDLFNKNKQKMSGIILISSHPKDGIIINENDFACNEFLDVKFYFVKTSQNISLLRRIFRSISERFSIICGIKSIIGSNAENTLYLITPIKPNIRLIKYFKNKNFSNKYSPIFVIVDEGFGSYVSKKIRSLVRNVDSKDIKSTIFLIKFSNYINLFLEKILMRYVKVEERLLFSKNKVHLEVNGNICDSYKNVLTLRNKDLEINNTGKKILIVTQPFSEYNQIPINEELKILDSLIKFINKKGIKPILKPHPREKTDKYHDFYVSNLEIIQSDFPVEELISVLNPICVIGYTSTALLNSKIFYNIISISLSNLILAVSDDELLTISTNEFIKITSDHIEFINKIDDICEFI
ncbi:MAG: polysialyltransferase family glycosyltransferase [Methanobacterium sp.]